MTALPAIDPERECSGCGLCVAACPGQAIFLVNEEYEPGLASITIPYEFLPLPVAGDKGKALDRKGKEVCLAEVTTVRTAKAFDQTNLLTIKVPADAAMKVRFFRSLEAEPWVK